MNKSLHQIIDKRIMPFFMRYLEEICDKKDELVIDGNKVFDDVFVPGTIVLLYGQILVNTDSKSVEYENLTEKLRTIISFAAEKELKTWGILFFLSGLNLLNSNNLLLKVADEQTLEKLKCKLDWRSFVNPEDLSMPKMATNYYGVALRISKLRELLGWEKEVYSIRLYEKLKEHIETFSGEYGYMDETSGEGRFDHYTMDIPEEMSSVFAMAEKEIPENIRKMVINAQEIILHLADDKGYGFSYGRSIGAHGDLVVASTLTDIALEGKISKDLMEEYYAYVVDAIDKYLNFWILERTNLISCWDEGRRTDRYRHKGRILEVNIGLMKKIYQMYLNWNKLGYSDKDPLPGYESKLLNSLKPFSFFQFAADEYCRGLAIIRDSGHVFSLPIINGGTPYYCRTPYLPVPNEPLVLETSPETEHPHLVPRLLLEDGKSLMPISYMKNIITHENGKKNIITYEQDELCLLGGKEPQKYHGIKSKTTFEFSPGTIERTDVFYSSTPVDIKEILLEFGTFSEEPQFTGDILKFGKGDIYEYQVIGLESCRIEAVENMEDFKTTHGSLKNNIIFKIENVKIDKEFRIKWILKYK